MNKYLVSCLVFVAGCGVKGLPMAPLNPAPIGRGEPLYSGPKAKVPVKNKYNYKLEEKEEAPLGPSRE